MKDKGLVIGGSRAVREALDSGVPVQALYVLKEKGRSMEALVRKARARGAKVAEVPREFLDRHALRHQGVVLVLSPVSFTPWQDVVFQVEQSGETPLLVALDGVEDTGNLGAIIRSAEILGVHGMVIPKRKTASITPAVVRTSAGAVFHLAVDRVSNISSSLKEMKKRGLWLVGTHLAEGEPLWRVDFTLPIVMVLGNEEKGLSLSVERSCDFLVKIPMTGYTGSLNVSAAAAVLFYEAMRQRASTVA
jgi:23S rRNA (guanosine2251-2'-O)-methyltransferase